MAFYVNDQNVVILWMLLLGFVLGILYDAFRVKRAIIPTGRIILFFEDVLFCALSGILFLFTAFVTNYGYVRWYEIAAVFLGFYVYRKTLGKIFSKVLIFVIKSVIYLIVKFVLFALSPVKVLLSALCRIITVLVRTVIAACGELKIKRYSARRMKKDIRRAKNCSGI